MKTYKIDIDKSGRLFSVDLDQEQEQTANRSAGTILLLGYCSVGALYLIHFFFI